MPVIKLNEEVVEVLFAARGNFRNELLRRHAFFLRGDHDRSAVGVVRPHKVHRIAAHSLMTHPDVGLDVLHDVADVERAVCVGQSGRHKKMAFLISHDHLS